MPNEILSFYEICQREKSSLQRGMNFRFRPTYSIVLMSVRKNSPYQDRVENDGSIIIYEGHDERKSAITIPKIVDQPRYSFKGTLTENGKFEKAVQDYKLRGAPPERVKVYAKIREGIWSYNGLFLLTDCWTENDGQRNVFKYKLEAVEEIALDQSFISSTDYQHRRVIPTWVKLEVWKRDGGKCVKCGAPDNLHYDHDLPYSKGGTSITPENVQLLCMRHNLEKSNKIE